MPCKGEPCADCGKPTKRGVPSPFGSDCGCEERFNSCIARWKARVARVNKIVPF